MKVSEKFEDIAYKISEATWTQGHYAITDNGESVNVGDPRAVAYCLEGWLIKESFPEGMDFLNRLVQPGNSNGVLWNDVEGRTVKDVQDLLSRASSLARFIEVHFSSSEENENA